MSESTTPEAEFGADLGNELRNDPDLPVEEREDDADDTAQKKHDHDDELVDEWGEESFPSSDPPAHY
ncbi:hypothetical protein [Brevibacterium samyangense]|uniref:Uncharacterized protein n=1 Tax=Brevibacterium samyangense TaxID=366888 RepID=A0ABP5EJ06_9MICO